MDASRRWVNSVREGRITASYKYRLQLYGRGSSRSHRGRLIMRHYYRAVDVLLAALEPEASMIETCRGLSEGIRELILLTQKDL